MPIRRVIGVLGVADIRDAGQVDRWDLAPILGWWRLRRRSNEPGFEPRFWVRPFIVECLCTVGFVAWYWWEAVLGGLLHPHIAPGLIAANGELSAALHASCIAHLVLFMFMLAASLIDVDEWNIPDEITVPGTLFGAADLNAVRPAPCFRRFSIVACSPFRYRSMPQNRLVGRRS